jgi:hypothetical protein
MFGHARLSSNANASDAPALLAGLTEILFFGTPAGPVPVRDDVRFGLPQQRLQSFTHLGIHQ